jgi:hypothetical protein
MSASLSLVNDSERLVAALRVRGVDYLAPSDAQGAQVDDETLIASLAAHENPRLVQALIALLLVHPELAPQVPPLRGRLAGAAGGSANAEVELLADYMAAVYLQSMWRIRLNHYLPPTPDLPDYFSAELGLPDREELYGEMGLYALAEWHRGHAHDHFNHLSEYMGVADLLLEDIKLKARRVATAGG